MQVVFIEISMDSPVKSSVSQALKAGLKLREYKIKRLLSVERDSFIYLAVDTKRDRLVTIKEYFPSRLCERDVKTGEVICMSDEDSESFDKGLKAFETLTMTLASLHHQGVPTQHHLFPENGTLYRVSNYINGYALTTLLDRQNDEECEWFYDEEELRGFLWRVLDILDYVHDHEVYHLDIKPRYIVFTRLGNPLLAHFCSRRELFDEREGARDDSVLYLAPEQWETSDPCGAWTDIYSLGAVFYRILSGHEPQRADKRWTEDIQPKLAEDPKLKKKYTAKFLEGIDKALNVKISDRFRTAEEWQNHLLMQRGFSKPEWLKGVPKSRKWIRSAWILGGIVLFFSLLWGAWLWVDHLLDIAPPEAVVVQKTELVIDSQNTRNGKIWGMQFTLRDRGFGVNPLSMPPVVTLSSISLHSVEPPKEQGTPPVFISIRDKEGTPLALSRNALPFAHNGKVEFNFDHNVVLSTSEPYQYVFVNEEGAVVLVDLVQTIVNPLLRKNSHALIFKTGGEEDNASMPVLNLKFEPNSGASPLEETLADAAMAQSQGYASPRNWCLHPGVTARQSSTYERSDASLAIDAQMSGESGSMTDPGEGNGWWLVSFGTGIERPVKKIILYNMPDNGMIESRRLSNYRIELFNRLGKEVASQDFHTEGNSWVKDSSESWVLPETVYAHSVRIRKLGKGAHPEDAALFLAEVEVVAPDMPYAVIPENTIDWARQPGVQATQSSTWRNWIATYGAYRAIDGQDDPRFYAHTNQDNNPGWWEVNLGENRPVSHIRLTNCMEKGLDALRLSNFRIILKDSNGDILLQKDFNTTPGDYAPLQTLWELPMIFPDGVRSIRVEKQGRGTHPFDNGLSLKKVEVFGPAE